MTITFVTDPVEKNDNYESVKSSSCGDTFVVTDNDGEVWCFIKDSSDHYIVLASTGSNYFPGTVYSTYENLLEALTDYECSVRKTDLKVEVDD